MSSIKRTGTINILKKIGVEEASSCVNHNSNLFVREYLNGCNTDPIRTAQINGLTNGSKIKNNPQPAAPQINNNDNAIALYKACFSAFS